MSRTRSFLRPVALALALPFLALPAAAQAPVPAQGALPAQVPPSGGLAETAPELRTLLTEMGLYDILEVMAAEGIAGGPEMEANMFPGRGGAAWAAVVAGIYSADRMARDFEAALPLDRLSEDHVATLRAFYATDIGARVAAGELAARQSFLEPGVEETAGELAASRAAEDHPRIALLTEFIAVNDLVELNVSGALNSNFAFYRGLSDGGAFAQPMPENLMLTEVWGQEGEIRTDLTEWLYAYQTLAYDDLEDAELRTYIDLTATEAGQALNAALFAGFAALFDSISYDLGVAAAHFISGEET
ncbi:hypothetical protein [Roseicyclus marinus]|uniref:hypothetical protein n=1 Tax=Roseicyclus marinus TaxID=2161673 RepID=UPI0024107119|nr:hypothetical protein [Roseicyclus marinus]MDG3039905.1 hypothetical protein [Roseicyclus marinus]